VYTILKDVQFPLTLVLGEYVYGQLKDTLPESPSIEVQESPEVRWYYSSDGSKINKEWSEEDITNYGSEKDASVKPWDKSAIDLLPIGLYYVKAIVGTNRNYEADQVETTFKILKGKKVTPSDIEATAEGVVTVNEEDREKELEYAVLKTGEPTETT